MNLEIPLLGEKGEMQKIVQERKKIRSELAAAGGEEFGFLLGDCEDLADIIEEIQEISSKRKEKEHAAFATKVKFSRKIRRKAKDLKKFEQQLVEEFDAKHISLGHARKMAEILKLLRSGKADEARREAEEFYSLLEMGRRLGEAEEMLHKKSAQLERAKRGVRAQLFDLEWLDAQGQPDAQKIKRHNDRMRIKEALLHAREEFIFSLQSMQLCRLLKKITEDRLEGLGFAQISGHDAEELSAFLQASGLEQKTCAQVLELAQLSGQRLAHLGIDVAGFRQHVLARKDFLCAIMQLAHSDFLASTASGSPALAYLSERNDEAGKIIAGLAALGSSEREDEEEWEKERKITEKKEGLLGAEKSQLEKMLSELEALESMLEGKDEECKTKKGRGFFERIAGFFKGG